MQIDVVSDTVCPWCYIGKRRLARALELRPEIEFDVQWRPYRLDPDVPREGVDRRAYMQAKFGNGPQMQAMGEALKAEGAKEGIAFAFDSIERRPDTLDSHRLIRWAAAAGVQDAVVERLFRAYFENGQDIGDIATLADIAAQSGLDREEIARRLATDDDAQEAQSEIDAWRRAGVTGVPFFIFDEKLAVSGAESVDTLVAAMIEAQNRPARTAES